MLIALHFIGITEICNIICNHNECCSELRIKPVIAGGRQQNREDMSGYGLKKHGRFP